MQEQKEDSEKQKAIEIPSPVLLDFKVKAAEFKSFAKVRKCTELKNVFESKADFHRINWLKPTNISDAKLDNNLSVVETLSTPSVL